MTAFTGIYMREQSKPAQGRHDKMTKQTLNIAKRMQLKHSLPTL